VSLAAVQLVRDAELVDLHIESYIPPRLWGYDLFERHDRHFLGGRYFGHLDLPRALDGGLTGGMWSIATNIARGARGRYAALRDNVAGLRATVEAFLAVGFSKFVVRPNEPPESWPAELDRLATALLPLQT